MPKQIIDYLGKEVQNKPAGEKDVDIVNEDSTSHSTDGRVQLNKNRKYCHFSFFEFKIKYVLGLFSVYDINY